MRILLLSGILMACSAPAMSAPISDQSKFTALPARLTAGWLHNSRNEVMSLFAPEAVFIPHDGVKPHVGKAAIDQFWFPAGRAVGTVTSFTKTVDGLSGEGSHAILWGRSDLSWQDDKTAYHWLGYYLIAAERRNGRWLITHLMSSDEQPTTAPVETK